MSGVASEFSGLSIQDLLDAREHYHIHLAKLRNVVGTAIGRYLIRFNDRDAKTPVHPATAQGRKLPPRTIANSGVFDHSWPAVIVFVNEWSAPQDLATHPEDFIPPRLYLPDGRIIPTCVVVAPRSDRTGAEIEHLSFPTRLLGGGRPILTDVQGREHVGSAGCLVTDGFATYALTSRHAVAEPGTPVYTIDHGVRREIGVAAQNSVQRIPFASIGAPASHSVLTVDAGLVRVHNADEWTAQIYGIGTLAPLADFRLDTLTLDIIGKTVKAFGGASGELLGAVKALYYRHKSVGGVDHVAELLIGARKADEFLATRPGDSGTLWVLDIEMPKDGKDGVAPDALPSLAPLAVQWGGHSLIDPGGGGTRTFALATSLATALRELDLELIRDWSLDHDLYWGKVGHYSIAFAACFLAATGSKLDTALQANAESIGVSNADIKSKNLPKATTGKGFVALADVPDLVWRSTRKKDEANHFADMDEPGAGRFEGKTLLDLWTADPASRTPATWNEFYSSVDPKRLDKHRGALPFRVTELYEAMVDAVQRKALAEYICIAGILAHFVGDACQPLHVSHLHHGSNADESGVHAVYETNMLERFSAEVVDGLGKALRNKHVTKHFTGGASAADEVVKLMARTIGQLSPEEVIETYNRTRGRNQLASMWEELGGITIKLMADGAMTLCRIWESAWIEGGGETRFTKAICAAAISKNKLSSLYNNRAFIESRWLKEM